MEWILGTWDWVEENSVQNLECVEVSTFICRNRGVNKLSLLLNRSRSLEVSENMEFGKSREEEEEDAHVWNWNWTQVLLLLKLKPIPPSTALGFRFVSLILFNLSSFFLPSQNNIAIFCLWLLYFLFYNLFVCGFIECVILKRVEIFMGILFCLDLAMWIYIYW